MITAASTHIDNFATEYGMTWSRQTTDEHDKLQYGKNWL